MIILAIPVANIFWWRWAYRKLERIESERGRRIARIALHIFMAFMLGSFATLIGTRSIGVRITVPGLILVPVYVWHLIVLPVTWIGIGATSLMRVLAKPTRRAHEAAGLQSRGLVQTGLSRRELLAVGAVALPPLAVAMTSLGAIAQLQTFRTRRIDVPIDDLPVALDGMTIAHLTDFHIGRFTRPGMLDRVADATNALRADLVLFTGDLIDFSLADLPAGIDFLRGLDPRSGFAVIEGNHDLFESRVEFEQRVLAAGIPLLLNESKAVRVRGFDVQLLGIKWGGAKSSGAMFEQHFQSTLPLLRRNRDTFPILLSHHPHTFDLAIVEKLPLTLCGHTHGGQLMLTPEFGAGSLMYKYWSGLYRRERSALVVSNGIGNWFPVRLNAPAEIVHITLRRQ